MGSGPISTSRSGSASRRLAGALRFGAPLAALLVAAGPAAASPGQVRARLGKARAPQGQLQRTAVQASHGVRFYRYRQELGGLPVLDSDVVVTDARGAKGDLLTDGSQRLGARRAATVRRASAEQIASHAAAGGPVLRPSLAVLPADGRAVTVWRAVVDDRPAALYEVLVDARTGAVLRKRNLLRFAEGRAALFD